MLETPVLFLVFNRPSSTRRVFNQLKNAKPARLFIAADGPRPDHSDDLILCLEVKEIIDTIDWPCEVFRLYRSGHLGCKRAVSDAISWFFRHVDQGIILEDDCLPVSSFFSFCSDMLDRYKNDPHVFQITGNNFQHGISRGEGSYYFSKYAHIWGWATWKRAWNYYDLELRSWPLFRISTEYQTLFSSEAEKKYWTRKLDHYYNDPEKADYWSLQWQFACWQQGGAIVTPQKNLVTNIGFGSGTHTFIILDHLIVPSNEFWPPYSEPADSYICTYADAYTFKHRFKYKGTFVSKVKYHIYRILKKWRK